MHGKKKERRGGKGRGTHEDESFVVNEPRR